MLEDLIRLLTFLTVVLRTHGGPHGAEPNERHGRRAPGRRSEQLCSHPRLCAALPGEGGLHRQQHAPGGARHANRRAGPTSCGGGPHVLPQHCHIGLRGWVEKVAGVYWHFFIDCRGGTKCTEISVGGAATFLQVVLQQGGGFCANTCIFQLFSL